MLQAFLVDIWGLGFNSQALSVVSDFRVCSYWMFEPKFEQLNWEGPDPSIVLGSRVPKRLFKNVI